MRRILRRLAHLVSFVFLLLAGAVSSVHAQDIDSLRKEVAKHTADDTVKANLYLQLAQALRYADPPTAGIMGRNAYSLSAQLGYPHGQAEARLVMAMSLLIVGDSMEQAVNYCSDAISTYASLHDTGGLATGNFVLASVRYNQSKFEAAIKHFVSAAAYYERTGNYNRQSLALDNLGVCCSAMANFSAALGYNLQALRIRERTRDNAGQATSLGNIAQVYANLGDTAKAIAYARRSVTLQEQYGDYDAKMITYENAGGVYGAMNDFKTALEQFRKALEMARAGNMAGAYNRIMVNMAEMHIQSGNWDEAEKLYQQCLTTNTETNNPAVQAIIIRGMGRVLVHKGKLREGIAELEKAKKRFEENEMKNDFYETHSDLSQAYEKVKDFEKALVHARAYHAFMDSLHSREAAQAHKLTYEYELQEKQDRIQLLEKDKDLNKARTDKQRIVNWSMGIGLLFLFLLLVVKMRAARTEAANKQQIVEQAERLHQLNTFKDKIFSVLSHDLRGPIGSLSVSMALIEQDLMTPEEFRELQPELSRQLTSVNFLLENLLSWSKSHLTGDRKVNITAVNLKKVLGHSTSLMQPVTDRKSLKVVDNVPAGLVALADENKVDMIIRNLLSNAIKFTPSGGTITITAAAAGGATTLSVTDTGIGMDKETLDSLFSPKPGNTFGTDGEKGVGLGLVLSAEFARALNGEIRVESQPGKGSTFTLVLPSNNG